MTGTDTSGEHEHPDIKGEQGERGKQGVQGPPGNEDKVLVRVESFLRVLADLRDKQEAQVRHLARTAWIGAISLTLVAVTLGALLFTLYLRQEDNRRDILRNQQASLATCDAYNRTRADNIREAEGLIAASRRNTTSSTTPESTKQADDYLEDVKRRNLPVDCIIKLVRDGSAIPAP